MTICQDRVFALFLCVLSLSSVLGSFTHMYSDTGLLWEVHPCIRVLQISVRGGEVNRKFYWWEMFLHGKGSIRKSDFDNLNLFQAKNSFL